MENQGRGLKLISKAVNGCKHVESRFLTVGSERFGFYQQFSPDSFGLSHLKWTDSTE